MEGGHSGGCQCGAVRFHAAALSDNAHVCHCRMCQKASGGLFGARVGVMLRDLTWTRGEPGRFRSSSFAVRGFCRDCGTPLFYHGDGRERVSVSLGAFDRPEGIALAFELGTESRLPQVGQLGHVEAVTTSEDDEEAEAEARRSSRQHPDHDTAGWPLRSGS